MAMVEEYRQFTRTQFHKDTSEGEVLLFQFQGSCYNCGKLGLGPTNVQMKALLTKELRRRVAVAVNFKENAEHAN
jgi:hypothetical protein